MQRYLYILERHTCSCLMWLSPEKMVSYDMMMVLYFMEMMLFLWRCFFIHVWRCFFIWWCFFMWWWSLRNYVVISYIVRRWCEYYAVVISCDIVIDINDSTHQQLPAYLLFTRNWISLLNLDVSWEKLKKCFFHSVNS